MDIQFWAGSETAYHAAIKAASRNAPEQSEAPDLYERVGSVGVVHIMGSLIPGDAGWMSMFGITGYSDIRAALVKAVDDEDVTSIMLDVNSGGGAVTGMSDTAAFIGQVAKLKPVTVYAENAASAAYRLAAEGSHITVSDSGVVGSIGVLRMHTEYSKQNEMEGVKTTVLRSGEFKTLINPVEALTPEAVAQEMKKLDYLAQSFSAAVATRRGLSQEDMKTKAGEGREFLGKQGVTVGLADTVGTYESALKMSQKLAKTSNRNASVAKTRAESSILGENTTTEGLDIMKPTLSLEQLAAIEAGVDLAETPDNLPEAPDTETEPAAAAVSEDSEVVKFLKTELAAASVTAAASASTIANLTSELEATKLTQEALLHITKNACASMAVALGGSKDAFTGMSAQTVISEHKTLSEKFKASFKVGGVAASSPVEDKQTAKPVFDPFFAALIRKTPAK